MNVKIKKINNFNELNILVESLENFYFLAGGTDILIKIKNSNLSTNLIDISSLKELKGIEETPDDIIIGSLTNFSEIVNSYIVQKYVKVLSMACSKIGSPQIRNQGTIGGNIANASPACRFNSSFICS